MTVQEYLKTKSRMCREYYDDCMGCPFNHPSCVEIEINNPRKAEEIMTLWANDHPLITNGMKFKEMFGFIPYIKPCPWGDTNTNPEFNSKLANTEWWEAEYNERKN